MAMWVKVRNRLMNHSIKSVRRSITQVQIAQQTAVVIIELEICNNGNAAARPNAAFLDDE